VQAGRQFSFDEQVVIVPFVENGRERACKRRDVAVPGLQAIPA
jgi:hypothetical protein